MSDINHLNLPQRLAYFTECQLATVEDLEDRRTFPKGQLQRHRDIATKMVDACREFEVVLPKRSGGPHFPRLARLLQPT